MHIVEERAILSSAATTLISTEVASVEITQVTTGRFILYPAEVMHFCSYPNVYIKIRIIEGI